MAKRFDPYRDWLGVPPGERPPNWYLLLGISRFESGRAEVLAAYQRQRQRVLPHSHGKHHDAAVEILRLLNQARDGILDTSVKRAYDERLRQSLPAEVLLAEAPAPECPGAHPSITAKYRHTSDQQVERRLVFTAVAVGMFCLVGLIVLGLASGRRLADSQPSSEKQPLAADRSDSAQSKSVVSVTPKLRSDPDERPLVPDTLVPGAKLVGESPPVEPAAAPPERVNSDVVADDEFSRPTKRASLPLPASSVPAADPEAFSGNRRLSLELDEGIALAVLPEGKQVAAVNGRLLTAWDVPANRPPRQLAGHRGTVHSLAASDAGLLSSSEDGTVRLWDALRGRTTQVFEGHAGTVASAVLSPDGVYVVSAGFDKSVRCWEVSTGRTVKVLSGTAPFTRVAFDPSGKQIVCATFTGTLVIWHVGSWKERTLPDGQGSPIHGVGFSSSGRELIVGTLDGGVGIINAEGGQKVATLAEGTATTALAIAPDGRRVLTGNDSGELLLWVSAHHCHPPSSRAGLF